MQVITAPELTQLIVAVTGLVTAFVTLFKVLQHDGIIKQTATQVTSTKASAEIGALAAAHADEQATAARETLETHLSALVDAAGAFHDSAKEQQPGP